MPRARLAPVELPILPRPEVAPELPASIYPACVDPRFEEAILVLGQTGTPASLHSCCARTTS